MPKATYKEAGVDLETYRESMRRIPQLAQRTFCPRVRDLPGGFAGLFRLDFDSQLFARNYESPVLVSCTDGVGTKLKVAQLVGRHDTVGIDLVAMCVNDAICCGAEPLFFLDYLAMSHDEPDLVEQLIEGVSQGCLQSDCALVGGETAIMPDLYRPGDYDMAGFCVGVAEQRSIIDGSAIAPGDVVLGLASSGLHSNGFSLVRRIVFDLAGMGIADHVDELGDTVGNLLLEPTFIYVRPVRRVLGHYKVKNVVHGIAHITGGGLAENIERVLPKQTQIRIENNSWETPPIFPWLQRLGSVDDEEMRRVFNMGIGMALIVSPYFADSVARMLTEQGVRCWRIGQVEPGDGKVIWPS
ncbi:MAG: phosphoribosylformylglycinamidine cyclo-ligase [Planctomycetales bacterium]|nr:phosphoribosylformylglycinamidine cyclo-ligase [Planctomycetales bacterium]